MTSHWHMKQDSDRIAWLCFDQQGSSVNILSEETLGQFETQLSLIDEDPPKGLVILSGKSEGFAAGADVNAFAGLRDQTLVQTYIHRVHRMFQRLEDLPFPTLALIQGFCLGGGLELALSCNYRVAEDSEDTRLGFPEIRLGIYPGFGGTVRSIRTLGPFRAMDMMLTGRSVGAHAALKQGLVDRLSPQRHLHETARLMLLQQPMSVRKPAWWTIANSRPVRPLIAAMMKRKISARIRPAHYPAPFALIDHWKANATSPARMYESEARQVSRLITGRTSQNLIRVFRLQEQLRALGRGTDDSITHVHVIGAGSMGGDIAAWCALKGLRVSIQDQSPEQLSGAVRRAHLLFGRKLRHPRLVRAAADRLIPDFRGEAIPKADLVIEAIVEESAVKRDLYREIEPRLKPHALLATNTSSIPLELLCQELGHPERLVGLHFFNPVARMQLVEVIKGEKTGQNQIEQAMAFTRRIDRLPLPVVSSPGFLVNRILMPYLLEAVVIEAEGIPAKQIDLAAREFGMPMGPLELADAVGLDICLSVAGKMLNESDQAFPEVFRHRVEQGQLGRKSGRGYYDYTGNKKSTGKTSVDPETARELSDRMVLRLLNEAVACLQEGVVEGADLVDAGVIFGTGFAPFTGGPLHYIRQTGPEVLMHRLQTLERRYGNRFSANVGWSAIS